MNRFGKLFAILSAAVCAFASCSRMDLQLNELDLDFEAEVAASYYFGYDEASSSHKFGLVLAYGRTDEEFNLISPGAVAFVTLYAPEFDGLSIPPGTYSASANAAYGYSFSYGAPVSDKSNAVHNGFFEWSGEGTYVVFSQLGEDGQTVYPVQGGVISIEGEGDGVKVNAFFEAQKASFGFEFDGGIPFSDWTPAN